MEVKRGPPKAKRKSTNKIEEYKNHLVMEERKNQPDENLESVGLTITFI